MHPTEREYQHAAREFQARLRPLAALATAADADDWGSGVFRRLLALTRAVQVDLEAELYAGPGAAGALERLHQFGAELGLQQWAEFWPSTSESGTILAAAERAAAAFEAAVRARDAAATATNQRMQLPSADGAELRVGRRPDVGRWTIGWCGRGHVARN
jgi:hypothetical protein